MKKKEKQNTYEYTCKYEKPFYFPASHSTSFLAFIPREQGFRIPGFQYPGPISARSNE